MEAVCSANDVGRKRVFYEGDTIWCVARKQGNRAGNQRGSQRGSQRDNRAASQRDNRAARQQPAPFDHVKISRLLSKHLRHKLGQLVGKKDVWKTKLVEQQGTGDAPVWVKVSFYAKSWGITEDQLIYAANEGCSRKKRFELAEDNKGVLFIRASQGHSHVSQEIWNQTDQYKLEGQQVVLVPWNKKQGEEKVMDNEFNHYTDAASLGKICQSHGKECSSWDEQECVTKEGQGCVPEHHGYDLA